MKRIEPVRPFTYLWYITLTKATKNPSTTTPNNTKTFKIAMVSMLVEIKYPISKVNRSSIINIGVFGKKEVPTQSNVSRK